MCVNRTRTLNTTLTSEDSMCVNRTRTLSTTLRCDDSMCVNRIILNTTLM